MDRVDRVEELRQALFARVNGCVTRMEDVLAIQSGINELAEHAQNARKHVLEDLAELLERVSG